MEGDSSSSSPSPSPTAAARPGAGHELFHDWELLQNKESDSVNSEKSGENQRNFEEVEGDYSEGMIRDDYFSIHNKKIYVKNRDGADVVSESGSVESDNPSWIDPGPRTQYQRKNLAEFWSEGSDRSEERKIGDFDGRNELGFVENVKNEVGFEGIGQFQGQHQDLGRFWSDSGDDGLVSMSLEGLEKEDEANFGDHVEKQDESVVCGKYVVGNALVEQNSSVAIEETSAEAKPTGKKGVAWWKVPFEVLKYCVLKVNPVWSFSMAAAVMGLVILGRRLYKMKRKSRSLQLNVTLDDKKVSQFMSRAARLNEAFSVVRRVPIVRPALPVPGANPWPVMSLR